MTAGEKSEGIGGFGYFAFFGIAFRTGMPRLLRFFKKDFMNEVSHVSALLKNVGKTAVAKELFLERLMERVFC